MPRAWRFLAFMAVVAAAGPAPARAATESILYSFGFTLDGASPYGAMARDASGSLYGVAQVGGVGHGGTAFRLAPPGAGQTVWTQTTIHSFDGAAEGQPSGGLILGVDGNLYGMTVWGTIFRLSPPPAGQTLWPETILHVLTASQGSFPYGALVADSRGALYGSTSEGGASDFGTVFQLSPSVTGGPGWRLSVLRSFTSGRDGAAPVSSLVIDRAGSLFGTAEYGGGSTRQGRTGPGTVFRLSAPTPGATQWSEFTVHAFGSSPSDGGAPGSGVTLDATGALYGATFALGTNGGGTVFKLTPPAPGMIKWRETVLHSFPEFTTDISGPRGGVVLGGAGAVYGTAYFDTGYNGCGGVYKLSPPAAGQSAWTETILHHFTGAPGDGCNPAGPLVLDASGTLYGTTRSGGAADLGTVFKIVP